MHPEWEHAKQRYHSTCPPEELSTGVEEAIRRGIRAAETLHGRPAWRDLPFVSQST